MAINGAILIGYIGYIFSTKKKDEFKKKIMCVIVVIIASVIEFFIGQAFVDHTEFGKNLREKGFGGDFALHLLCKLIAYIGLLVFCMILFIPIIYCLILRGKIPIQGQSSV